MLTVPHHRDTYSRRSSHFKAIPKRSSVRRQTLVDLQHASKLSTTTHDLKYVRFRRCVQKCGVVDKKLPGHAAAKVSTGLT